MADYADVKEAHEINYSKTDINVSCQLDGCPRIGFFSKIKSSEKKAPQATLVQKRNVIKNKS